jgi:type VI secretion system lysozyme-like protein
MIGPRYLPGCLPPLFERLIDVEPLENSDQLDANRLQGRDLRASVARAIARLLDTRRHVPLADAAAGGPLTVLDYGIPDFGNRSPMDADARLQLGLAIRHAIRAFEPRLKEPSVEVLPPMAAGRDLEVLITGQIFDGRITEPVVFRRTQAGDVSDTDPDGVG